MTKIDLTAQRREVTAMAVDGMKLDVNYDVHSWLLVPMWLSAAPEYMSKPWVRQNSRTYKRAAGYFQGVLEIARGMSPHDQLWILMAPGAPSAMMAVDYGHASDAPNLFAELTGPRPEQAHEPQVSTIETSGLGKGTRVLRQDYDTGAQDGTIDVTLYHYFRAGEVVVLMNAHAGSLDEVASTIPYIESLVYGMRLAPDDAPASTDAPDDAGRRSGKRSLWRRASAWVREDS